ncbi:hypothetical protein [Nocardia sp. NPDC059228]|uniref:hypothetical protein n=1 Tax=Nocardia sp. NPDC059228 TaxID=3346777 RepID=UPI0036C46035
MADSIRTVVVRSVRMPDIAAALTQTRPSTGPWFESARNVVEFANYHRPTAPPVVPR